LDLVLIISVGTTIDLTIEVLIIGGLEADGAGTTVLIIGGIILFGTHIITIMHLDRALIMALTMAFITLISELFRILTGSIITVIMAIQE